MSEITIGVIIGTIVFVVLIGFLSFLGLFIYRRFERIQDEEKSIKVDNGHFTGESN